MRDYYKPGDWNAICDRCGFKFKASELKQDWQGFRVCVHDFETRHSQDFLKGAVDKVVVPWVRADVPTGYVNASSSAIGKTINGAVINEFVLG